MITEARNPIRLVTRLTPGNADLEADPPTPSRRKPGEQDPQRQEPLC